MTKTTARKREPEPAASMAETAERRGVSRETLIGTWDGLAIAMETYWPGLGFQVVDQILKWNRQLFEGKLVPKPYVLGHMVAIEGHYFPLRDQSGNISAGYHDRETALPNAKIRSVSRNSLLRGVFGIYCKDIGIKLSSKDANYCALLMEVHRKLTGDAIWVSPEQEQLQEPAPNTVGVRQLRRWQDPAPDGRPSVPRDLIRAWPGSMVDLGYIQRTEIAGAKP